jgi:hypothetical protein
VSKILGGSQQPGCALHSRKPLLKRLHEVTSNADVVYWVQAARSIAKHDKSARHPQMGVLTSTILSSTKRNDRRNRLGLLDRRIQLGTGQASRERQVARLISWWIVAGSCIYNQISIDNANGAFVISVTDERSVDHGAVTGEIEPNRLACVEVSTFPISRTRRRRVHSSNSRLEARVIMSDATIGLYPPYVNQRQSSVQSTRGAPAAQVLRPVQEKGAEKSGNRAPPGHAHVQLAECLDAEPVGLAVRPGQ